jgi:hypothetical protein
LLIAGGAATGDAVYAGAGVCQLCSVVIITFM